MVFKLFSTLSAILATTAAQACQSSTLPAYLANKYTATDSAWNSINVVSNTDIVVGGGTTETFTG